MERTPRKDGTQLLCEDLLANVESLERSLEQSSQRLAALASFVPKDELALAGNSLTGKRVCLKE